MNNTHDNKLCEWVLSQIILLLKYSILYFLVIVDHRSLTDKQGLVDIMGFVTAWKHGLFITYK